MKILNVLNMKKLVFPFLVMVMLGWTGCMKPGDNIQDFQYVVAFVEFDFELGLFQNVLKTASGTMASNEIQRADLYDGDALLAFFTVNFDQQVSDNYTLVYDFNYIKCSRGVAEATPGGASVAGDFDLPIGAIDIFGGLDNSLFFGFRHKDISDKDNFIYEMTYDVNEPVVYLRAKKNATGSKNTVCAFNMYRFFSDHKNADNKVTFTIKYKTGVKDNGEDDYETFVFENGSPQITVEIH